MHPPTPQHTDIQILRIMRMILGRAVSVLGIMETPAPFGSFRPSCTMARALRQRCCHSFSSYLEQSSSFASTRPTNSFNLFDKNAGPRAEYRLAAHEGCRRDHLMVMYNLDIGCATRRPATDSSPVQYRSMTT